MWCHVICYKDFPAIEWVVRSFNTSVINTALFENVTVVDHSFTYEKQREFIFHHALGSNAMRNDFQPVDERLDIGKNVYITPAGGRSSANTALPFFNIEAPGESRDNCGSGMEW